MATKNAMHVASEEAGWDSHLEIKKWCTYHDFETLRVIAKKAEQDSSGGIKKWRAYFRAACRDNTWLGNKD